MKGGMLAPTSAFHVLVDKGRSDFEVEKTSSSTKSILESGIGQTLKPVEPVAFCERSWTLQSQNQNNNIPFLRQEPVQQSTLQIPPEVLQAADDSLLRTVRISRSDKDHSKRRKEWKSVFRWRLTAANERKENDRDTNNFILSRVDDEHNKKADEDNNKKKKGFRSILSVRRRSYKEQNIIERELTMQKSGLPRKELYRMKTTSDSVTAIDTITNESHTNQANVILNGSLNLSENDCNNTVHEGVELVLGSESSVCLSLPTAKEDCSKQAISQSLSMKEMSEYRKMNSFVDDKAYVPGPFSQSRKDHHHVVHLTIDEFDCKENCNEGKVLETLQSNVRIVAGQKDEPHEQPYFVQMTHDIFALPSCFRDTSVSSSQLPSWGKNVTRRVNVSDRCRHNGITGLPEVLTTSELSQSRGWNVRNAVSLTLPSCTPDTSSLLLTLSSDDEDCISEELNDHSSEKTMYKRVHKKVSSCRYKSKLSQGLTSTESPINVSVPFSVTSGKTSDENKQHQRDIQLTQKPISVDEEHRNQHRSIFALLACHRNTTTAQAQETALGESVQSEQLSLRTPADSRCLSESKKDRLRNRAIKTTSHRAPAKAEPTSHLTDTKRQKGSGLDPDLVMIPRHNLLSFPSFSHASEDPPIEPLVSHVTSNFPSGLHCIVHGGAINKEIPRISTKDGDSYSSLSDPKSFADTSLTSSPSMAISEFVNTADMVLKVAYSDLSSLSLSFASSHTDSEITKFSLEADDVNRNAFNTVEGVDNGILRQIAAELKIDPAELLCRLQAGHDIKNLVRDELLKRTGERHKI